MPPETIKRTPTVTYLSGPVRRDELWWMTVDFKFEGHTDEDGWESYPVHVRAAASYLRFMPNEGVLLVRRGMAGVPCTLAAFPQDFPEVPPDEIEITLTFFTGGSRYAGNLKQKVPIAK